MMDDYYEHELNNEGIFKTLLKAKREQIGAHAALRLIPRDARAVDYVYLFSKEEIRDKAFIQFSEKLFSRMEQNNQNEPRSYY